MKTVGFRSMVLYLLLFVFLGGTGYLVFNFFLHGSQWAMQPYNGHLYSEEATGSMGEIKDRNGVVLAATADGSRQYCENETFRRAMLHTVGDPYGNISTSVEFTMRSKLTGYNPVFGLNNVFGGFGRDIDLTVSGNACGAGYNALNGHKGAIIVYNYKTGDVLCKVSAPTFDPAYVPENIDDDPAYNGVYLDNTLSSSYTPGSIFKLVTAAAAMEKWPDSWSERSYDCQGSMEIGGSDVTCLNHNAHGTQDMFTAMGNSCNVYFAQLARDIGAADLQKKAKELGFNTELRFGNIEVAESTIDLSSCNENQLGWAGVGQYTVLANPYHMMVLMGAIANGGTYVEPRLTKDSSIFGSLTGGGGRLVSASEATQLSALLRNNVENFYGDWMFPEGLQVCAKSGTGEVGEEKAPNCWMIGFCQSEEYPYAFAVMVEEGEGGIENAGNAAAAVLSVLVS